MDNPIFYFKYIFNKINENYLKEHSDKINEIKLILPNLNENEIYEALHVCNYNLENAINYLYDSDIIII